MNRTDTREFMMQVFYQMDMAKDQDLSHAVQYLGRKNLGEQEDYARKLYTLYCLERDKADEPISRFSRKWKLSRMAKTDLAILRLGTFEILAFDDIPDAVAINEAVDLAKKYGTDHAPQFVNAILGKIHASKESSKEEPSNEPSKEPDGHES